MHSRDRTSAFLPARYYALLVQMVHGTESPTADWLASLGLDAEILEDPHALLGLDQVDALIEHVAGMSGRDDLGLQLGRQIKPSSHATLGYALMTSATLDEALQLASRYWRLISPAFRLSHEKEARGTRLTVEACVALSARSLRFHVETIATAFHEEVRFLLSGNVPAYDIHFPQNFSVHPEINAWLAPARIHFDMSGSMLQMVIPVEATMRPLALADRAALGVARQRCDDALAHMTLQGTLGTWVRSMLEQASDHQPRQQELARMLHMSTRTMNRRLAAEGTSFRELGILTRQARARQMLSESRLSITRIALHLGYQDTANFTRAFRIENGITPANFRNRNRMS